MSMRIVQLCYGCDENKMYMDYDCRRGSCSSITTDVHKKQTEKTDCIGRRKLVSTAPSSLFFTIVTFVSTFKQYSYIHETLMT